MGKAAPESLEGPEIPDSLRYLWHWLLELHGRSGVTGGGHFAPLSYATIVAWSVLSGHQPEPREVDALLWLDAVYSNPDAVKKNG